MYTSDDQLIEGEIETGKRYEEKDFNKIIDMSQRTKRQRKGAVEGRARGVPPARVRSRVVTRARCPRDEAYGLTQIHRSQHTAESESDDRSVELAVIRFQYGSVGTTSPSRHDSPTWGSPMALRDTNREADTIRGAAPRSG